MNNVILFLTSASLFFFTLTGATFIGKALIKVNGQAAFFIMIFTPKHLGQFVDFVEKIIPDNFDICHKLGYEQCHILLDNLLKQVQAKFKEQHEKV
jgi:hypothetical protein